VQKLFMFIIYLFSIIYYLLLFMFISDDVVIVLLGIIFLVCVCDWFVCMFVRKITQKVVDGF